MKNKISRAVIYVVFLVALMSMSVLAGSTYPNLGGDDSDFREGDGNWNLNIDLGTVIQNTRTIGDQIAYPIVEDLDGDGVNEIIYLNGNSLLIMQDIDLSVIASLAIGSTQNISNILAFDIDGDGFKEVIYAQEASEFIIIAKYNGTDLTSTSIDLAPLSMADPEMMIGCKGTNDCLIAFVEDVDSTVNFRSIRASGFNSTALSTNELTIQSSDGGGIFGREGTYCLPKLKFIDTSEDVFTFTYGSFQFSGIFDQQMEIAEVTRSGSVISKSIIATRESGVFIPASQTFSCTNDLLGNLFTSVTKGEISSSDAGVEYIIATMIDVDEFKIYTFENDGTPLDDYPEVTEARGDIISNPIIMSAFEDTGDVDFCVVGYSTVFDELDVTCGSEETGDFLETREYEFENINAEFNISLGYGLYNSVAHGVQYSETTTDGENLHEIVTPFGVFSLDTSLGNSLDRIYEITIQDGVVIPVDYQKVNLEDLLILTSTNLYYIDDGFTNTGGQITGYSINPCIDSIWQVNTSVNVQITVDDLNSDNVASNAILYAGTSQEIDNGFSVNSTAGSSFNFNFIANETTSNSILKLIGRDIIDPTEEDVIELSYTVASTGVEQGDCQTIVTIGLTEDEEETIADILGVDEDNSITTAIETLDASIGGGLGTTVIWFLFMIAIAFMIVRSDLKGPAMAGSIFVVEFMMMVLGTILGFFSIALVITIAIPIIAIVAIIGAKFILGSRAA